MALITKMLRFDKCIYWAPLGMDDNGQRTFAAPVEISCRWEDTITEFMDKMGNRALSTSVVFTDRDVLNLGALWHGKFTTITDMANPFNNEGAYEIRMFKKTPDFRNKQILRIAYL